MATYESLLNELGLDLTASERDIRRAYAVKLKQLDPEADPAAFQDLHELYQILLGWARHQVVEVSEVQPDPALSLDEDSPALETAALEVTAETPQEDGPQQAYEEAERVFADLLEQLAEQHSRLSEERFAAAFPELLKSSLADPALVSIETKDLFEWCVAQHLTRGWRPGNEALFDAAVDAFGWENDAPRLARFGNVGAYLNTAITETLVFRQQEEHERKKQTLLLRRLRSSEKPGTNLLLQHAERIEYMINCFPALLGIVTSEENITLWRELHQAIPSWQRKLTPTFGDKLSKPKVQSEGFSFGNWGWFAFMLVMALSKCATTTHQTASYEPLQKSPFVTESTIGKVGSLHKDFFDATSPVSPSSETTKPAGVKSSEKQRTKSNSGGSGNGPTSDPRPVPSNPKPIHPLQSRRLGEYGTVMMSVHIMPNGRPAMVEVAKSSGYPRLDQAAFDAVKEWTYIPAQKDGVPVRAAVRFEVKFVPPPDIALTKGQTASPWERPPSTDGKP